MFETFNYVEAGLWSVIGLMLLAFAVGRSDRARRRCILAAVTFLLFGVSDLVEVQSGAWWRPWWLSVWKGICIVTMLLLLREHLLSKRPPK